MDDVQDELKNLLFGDEDTRRAGNSTLKVSNYFKYLVKISSNPGPFLYRIPMTYSARRMTATTRTFLMSYSTTTRRAVMLVTGGARRRIRKLPLL